MRMLAACIYEQVSEQIVTKTGLGEHTLYCSPYKLFRAIGENLLGCCKPLSTRVSGVTGVNTVGHLLAAEGNLLCVYYDDVVTTVNVGSVAGLGLAAKDKSNTGCKTTKREICRVNDNPLLVYGRLVERYRFVALCVHCLDL